MRCYACSGITSTSGHNRYNIYFCGFVFCEFLNFAIVCAAFFLSHRSMIIIMRVMTTRIMMMVVMVSLVKILLMIVSMMVLMMMVIMKMVLMMMASLMITLPTMMMLKMIKMICLMFTDSYTSGSLSTDTRSISLRIKTSSSS